MLDGLMLGVNLPNKIYTDKDKKLLISCTIHIKIVPVR